MGWKHPIGSYIAGFVIAVNYTPEGPYGLRDKLVRDLILAAFLALPIWVGSAVVINVFEGGERMTSWRAFWLSASAAALSWALLPQHAVTIGVGAAAFFLSVHVSELNAKR
jgi:hypothetical protein